MPVPTPPPSTQENPLELLRQAFCADDAGAVAALLENHPELRARINDPIAAFDSPMITQARSVRMLDLLWRRGQISMPGAAGGPEGSDCSILPVQTWRSTPSSAARS